MDGINEVNPCHVRIYRRVGSVWSQLGGSIEEADFALFDRLSVSISNNGNTVAIGAPYSDGIFGVKSGYVQVYRWNGSGWVQKGPDIDGEAAGYNSGYSVSLSGDGNIVAIGAPYSDSGHVRVYRWNGSGWVQEGSDIDGEAADDRSGYSVSLSGDGSMVAIGARDNDGMNGGDGTGYVRVYRWNGSGWVQEGSDIDGEAAEIGLVFLFHFLVMGAWLLSERL